MSIEKSVAQEVGGYLYLRGDIHPPVFHPTRDSDQAYRKKFVAWGKSLNDEQRTLHEVITGQVFGLLGVASNHELRDLIKHPDRRQTASDRTLEQLGLIHGIEGGLANIRRQFADYSDDANAVIDYLKTSLSYEGCVSLEMRNEISASTDPADLLFKSLDGSLLERARFEAKRKLQLILLSAAIDRREREIKTKDQFTRFVNWMGERFWNPQSDEDTPLRDFIISTHDPQTWTCLKAKLVDEETGAGIPLQPYQKKTHVEQRSFQTDEGQTIKAYATTREKTKVAKIIKMLRKGEEDPAIAVDDDNGLLVVVRNAQSAIYFIRYLIKRGYQSNYPILVEDVSNTLDGGEYKGNAGSSPEYRQMKFFARLANEMRIECIVHTLETYAESLYKRDVSHDEYDTNRLYESGVPNKIFPPKYFRLFDAKEANRQKIAQIRRDIEGT